MLTKFKTPRTVFIGGQGNIKRIAIGGLALDSKLAAGQCRELTVDEKTMLLDTMKKASR